MNRPNGQQCLAKAIIDHTQGELLTPEKDQYNYKRAGAGLIHPTDGGFTGDPASLGMLQYHPLSRTLVLERLQLGLLCSH